ncbi:HNH endonuclease [candidate division KSB1 bacterium]|nr:HNH endonuclease [candidate division KSB1 bacterium]MBL7092956.1 HNH endonuclease [candidate division KSB1 bacterium]
MKQIIIQNEKEIIEQFKKSEDYKYFTAHELPRKQKREKIAWELIREHSKNINKNLLIHIFKIVDDNTNYWFGPLFQTPNLNKFKSNPTSLIQNLFDEIFNSNRNYKTIINNCVDKGKLKISGADRGFVTLLLYLSNPDKYNIWMPTTEKAIKILHRIKEKYGQNNGDKYEDFNNAANNFKKVYNFSSKEMDWIFTCIKKNVIPFENNYKVKTEMFRIKKVNVSNGFELYLKNNNINFESFQNENIQHIAEEIEEPEKYFEGSTIKVSINRYERNSNARTKCINHFGAVCFVCGFNFTEHYKNVKKEYIQVHHIKPFSKISEAYQVDPIKDLRPACPNCHAVIHMVDPAYTIDEVIKMLK